MKTIKVVAVVLFLMVSAVSSPADVQESHDLQKVRVYGRVTDFEGLPIEGASVLMKDKRFYNVAETTSDSDGRYSFNVPKGHHLALLAVKDYQVRFLEYWAWSVPAFRDLEINPRIDRLEVYAINAWRPQGAYPSYQIYFRPMSLTAVKDQVEKAGSLEEFNKLPILNIAPELSKKDIRVVIDGEEVALLETNKIRESAGPGQYMYGYLIQVELPKKKTECDYSFITITLTDPENGDKGEGSLFLLHGFEK